MIDYTPISSGWPKTSMALSIVSYKEKPHTLMIMMFNFFLLHYQLSRNTSFFFSFLPGFVFLSCPVRTNKRVNHGTASGFFFLGSPVDHAPLPFQPRFFFNFPPALILPPPRGSSPFSHAPLSASVPFFLRSLSLAKRKLG